MRCILGPKSDTGDLIVQEADSPGWLLEAVDSYRAAKITCVAFEALRLHRQERQAAATQAAARLKALLRSMIQRAALQVWSAQVRPDESCQALSDFGHCTSAC